MRVIDQVKLYILSLMFLFFLVMLISLDTDPCKQGKIMNVFCPKVVYKLLKIAPAFAIKEAHSFLAHCRLALTSIHTLFG